jgi:hypothetical protein
MRKGAVEKARQGTMMDLGSFLIPILLVGSLALTQFWPESHVARYGSGALLGALLAVTLISSYYDLPLPDIITPAIRRGLSLTLIVAMGAVVLTFALRTFIRDFRAASRKRAETSAG